MKLELYSFNKFDFQNVPFMNWHSEDINIFGGLRKLTDHTKLRLDAGALIVLEIKTILAETTSGSYPGPFKFTLLIPSYAYGIVQIKAQQGQKVP